MYHRKNTPPRNRSGRFTKRKRNAQYPGAPSAFRGQVSNPRRRAKRRTNDRGKPRSGVFYRPRLATHKGGRKRALPPLAHKRIRAAGYAVNPRSKKSGQYTKKGGGSSKAKSRKRGPTLAGLVRALAAQQRGVYEKGFAKRCKKYVSRKPKGGSSAASLGGWSDPYAAMATNPSRRKRRGRRSNPGGYRRRRSHGIRRNPPIMTSVRRIFSVGSAVVVGSGVLGFGLSLTVPTMLAEAWGKPALNKGAAGVAMSVGTSMLLGVVGRKVGGPVVGASLYSGGMIAAGVKLVSWLLPQVAKKLLPMGRNSSTPPVVMVEAPHPGGAIKGMGSIETSEQMVLEEAAYQSGGGRGGRGFGDWMELQGMGDPVYAEEIRGIGMGDWVEMQGPAVAGANGQGGWAPSSDEHF